VSKTTDKQLDLLDEIMMLEDSNGHHSCGVEIMGLRKALLQKRYGSISTPPPTPKSEGDVFPKMKAVKKKGGPIDQTCPSCLAEPGSPCRRVRGANAGSEMAGDYHAGRSELAGTKGSRQPYKKRASEKPWLDLPFMKSWQDDREPFPGNA